jgi:hypothetical protein
MKHCFIFDKRDAAMRPRKEGVVMTRISKFFLVVMAGLAVSGLGAQTASVNSMSLNGATGLYSIPTGRIGWGKSSDLALDLGYHMVYDEEATHIPKVALSIFKWVEVSLAFDFQPDYYGPDGTDFIGGLKLQLPLSNTAIAVGGNLQALNLGNDFDGYNGRYNAGQIYLAVTYAGSFFEMPAETTVVVGKTFVEDISSSDIDFGMGFDLILLPKIFQRYIHWVTDFANFSYSDEAIGANAGYRGVLNTGLRVDLSAIPALNKFKFTVDVMITDVLDDGDSGAGSGGGRSFSVGAAFGLPLL